VLLILHFQIQKILVETELYVHCEVWKQKVPSARCYDDASPEKKIIEKYLCWFAHEKLYVHYDTMLERIVCSISSSNNIHKVVYDNSNRYRSMVMDAMRTNHGYSGEGSRVVEQPNIYATNFF
jgi:hypothetical protein